MNPGTPLNDVEVRTSLRDVGERLRVRSRATGALVMSGFGALWASLGLPLSSAPSWAWIVLAAAASAPGTHAVRLLRDTPRAVGPLPVDVARRWRRARRVFLWANVGQALGIFLAGTVVASLGHPQWRVAAAMAVVGLHFLPLAAGFGYRPHWVTGAAMTAWALAYPGVFAAGAMAPAGMFGAAAILFASAAWALRSANSAR